MTCKILSVYIIIDVILQTDIQNIMYKYYYIYIEINQV